MLALAAAAGAALDRPLAYFTREPAAALEVASCSGVECTFVGFVSNAGVLVWAATAGICLFAAGVVHASTGRRAPATPYLAFGLLTALAAADDVFLLHDYADEWGIALGERKIVTGYGLVAIAIVLVFRRFLARTTVWLLALAFALFVVSVAFDFFADDLHLVEDGSKLLGIATWSVFLVGTAFVDLRRRAGGRPAGADS